MNGRHFFAVFLCANVLWLTGCASKTPSAAVDVPKQVPAVAVQPDILKDEKNTYTLDVQKPKTGIDAVDNRIDAFVQPIIDDFLLQNQQIEDRSAVDELKSDLTIAYTVVDYQSRINTFVFDVSEYIAGAAHPNSFKRTLAVRLDTGAEIPLSSVFLPGSDYLTRLSKLSYDRLTSSDIGAMSDDDWIRTGVGPDELNFRSFSLGADALTLYLDPYQVAAYAAGPQQVVIPYSDLKDILAQPFGGG